MKRFLSILAGLTLVHPAFGSEPPPLDKADAQLIMQAMDWTEVTVIAIRQGVDAKGPAAPVYATVLGVGTLRGEHHSISQTLYYDKDLDWHFIEMRDKGARIWSKNGYQEIKPWATW